MSELYDKRILFSRLVPLLLQYIQTKDLQYTLEYIKRCEECKVGKKASCHKYCLAIDINLFDVDNNYLDETKDHYEIGMFWESLHPDCRWGGRFKDGNHYSVQYKGLS